jgi:hypothetical protein
VVTGNSDVHYGLRFSGPAQWPIIGQSDTETASVLTMAKMLTKENSHSIIGGGGCGCNKGAASKTTPVTITST